MNITHPELIKLYTNILSPEIQSVIIMFTDNEVEKKESYNTESIWLMDQLLGGIGGYSMPSDPKVNPFPGGEKRELYRPLQYARSEIDICDIRISARHVVHMSGMHLEAVCRLFLKINLPLGSIRPGNTTFGKAVRKIEKLNILDDTTIEALFEFVPVFNRAKHEVNNDDTKERFFNSADALVSYFSARVLGLKLLQSLNYPDSTRRFKINNTEFHI